MADWAIQLISIYLGGAVISVFLCNIVTRYMNLKSPKRQSIDLTEDDVGGIVLCTIFWPVVLPLIAIFWVGVVICNVINNTAISIVKSLSGTPND